LTERFKTLEKKYNDLLSQQNSKPAEVLTSTEVSDEETEEEVEEPQSLDSDLGEEKTDCATLEESAEEYSSQSETDVEETDTVNTIR